MQLLEQISHDSLQPEEHQFGEREAPVLDPSGDVSESVDCQPEGSTEFVSKDTVPLACQMNMLQRARLLSPVPSVDLISLKWHASRA